MRSVTRWNEQRNIVHRYRSPQPSSINLQQRNNAALDDTRICEDFSALAWRAVRQCPEQTGHWLPADLYEFGNTSKLRYRPLAYGGHSMLAGPCDYRLVRLQ